MMVDYEQMLEDFYTGVLRPGDIAVDAGAHIGRHTLPMMSAIAPDGKVLAFEPLPAARLQLEQAVAGKRSAVTIYPYALADREGEDEFVVAVDLPAYSGLKTRTYDYPTRLERIRVEVRSLDRLLAGISRCDYVKIDAEGGELGILRGAMQLLQRFAPVITFEFGANSLGSYGITVKDMAEFWAERPYVVFDILGRKLDFQQFVDSAVRQEVWDYVALPTARASQLLTSWERP